MTVMDCVRNQIGDFEMYLKSTSSTPAFLLQSFCVVEKFAKGGTLHFEQRSSLEGFLEKCPARIRAHTHNILMKRESCIEYVSQGSSLHEIV